MTMRAHAPSPERWGDIEAAFHAILDLPPSERERAVLQLSARDASLADEVRSLLAAHDGTGLLDAVTRVRTPTPAPQWVGPYRVLRELGHGGMGTVFLAERSGDGFTQHVALKLIRADYADPRLEAALASERRILARLEHPSIARFIDGGATPSGQPYVAMEHVAGTPLLDFCERRGLSGRRRLALFVRICEGVQYAHQQLVVHRDLKPNNILVTDDGRPVLLDFGVARLLDESASSESGTTANWVTPAYAAPEQLFRQPVTTRTDVYALGVILYEMLVGRLPYAAGDGSIAAMVHAVCEIPPITPSAAARLAGNARLARTLTGDLDTILCKALDKEPDRRYGSVEQFADDVRRYLAGRPVLASPDTLLYRARKFAQRNRALVVTAVALTATLLGGIAATAWQGRVARQERDRAREALAQSQVVTGFLLNLFESTDPRRTPGDTVTARAILQRGLSRVEELSGQPVVQARMLDALGRVLSSLGQYERAQQLVERGLALRRGVLPPQDPDIAAGNRRLAEILRERGAFVRAESLLVAALAIHRAGPAPPPLPIAETLSELAFLMPYLGRMAAAESLYVEAYDIRARVLGDDDPLTLQSRLAVALRRRFRDPDGARTEMRRILEVRRRVLGEQHPDVALSMLHLADALVTEDAAMAEAESLYAGAVEIQRRTGESDLSRTVHGLDGLSVVATRRGDHRRAEALMRELLAVRLSLLGPDHPSVHLSRDAVATILVRQGRLAEAEAIKLGVLDALRRIYGEPHHNIAAVVSGLVALYEERGDLARAEQYAREALAIREQVLAPTHNHIAIARITLARVLERRGRRDEARALAARARAQLAEYMSDEDESMQEAARILARLDAAR